MTRALPKPPSATWGTSALLTFPDEHLVLAHALLSSDSPLLPDTDDMCRCEHGRLYHADRWNDERVDLDLATGPCTVCRSCDAYTPAVTS